MTGPLHLSAAAQDAADRLRQRRAAHQHQQRLQAQLAREAALQAARDQHQVPLGDRIHTALLLDGPATCTQLAERVEATPHATRKALLTLETHGRATHRLQGTVRVWATTVQSTDPVVDTRLRRRAGTIRHRILTHLTGGATTTSDVRERLGMDARQAAGTLHDAHRHGHVTRDPTTGEWRITRQGQAWLDGDA